MIKKGISVNKCNKKKQALYKIQKDSYGAEFPSLELVEVGKTKHHLVSIKYFISDPDLAENSAIKDLSEFSRDFSMVKKLTLEGSISRGSSIKKVLKSFPKHCASMAVIVGTDQESSLGSSIARCCANKLPATSAVFVIYKDRIISTKSSVLELKGFRLNYTRPVFENTELNEILAAEYATRYCREENKEKFSLTSTSLKQKEQPDLILGWPLLRRAWLKNHEIKIDLKDDTAHGSSRSLRDETLSLVPGHIVEPSSSSVSLLVTHSKPGWPLLRISAPVTSDSSKQSADTTSLNQSTPASPQSQKNSVSSSHCKEFSYAELEEATCRFSLDNLIGEGGCSNVYKGCLSNGKSVAVKVLKSYKEAWNDFSMEVDIISSLKHQNITPLIGVCAQDNNLMLVYDFLPNRSLEESLHGNNEKVVLAWEVRFKVAVAIAEALNYLHKECLRPVIHRDVKSSNILFSSDFNPQLSDFGLAIWGPTDKNYMIYDDVVGTFGYIAPEYFMQGRISDKVDVYSYGVVLLELLSGRRPIASRNLRGQESLVKWAKPILESGDVEALMDPRLDDDFDIAQMQRLGLVANLCVNPSAQLRPTVSEILELLRGKKDAKEWVKLQLDETLEDDEFLIEFGGKPHLAFSNLVSDDAASLSSSTKQKRRFKLKDYLKEPQDYANISHQLNMDI